MDVLSQLVFTHQISLGTFQLTLTDLTHSNTVATNHAGLKALVCKLIPVSPIRLHRPVYILSLKYLPRRQLGCHLNTVAGIKSRVDGLETLVGWGALEGPDLKDQTAERKQTKQIQFRDVFQSDGTQRKLKKVLKLQSKLFITYLKNKDCQGVLETTYFCNKHYGIRFKHSLLDSKIGHVCSRSGLDIMFISCGCYCCT